jgi:hypothetical protein
MRIHAKLLFLLAMASVILFLGESPAFAQRYYGRGYYGAPRYGIPLAHDGFYMRLHAGFGYLDTSESMSGVKYSYSGGGATIGAAFGGTIAPNLILYGEFLGTSVAGASVTVGGLDYGEVDMTLYGIGPGIAYYFMPINLYLSGTLTFTRISFTDSYTAEDLSDTDIGIGLSLMVGKEWWVARDWGLGLAGQIHIASMRDNYYGYNPRMRAAAISLLFSATYN